MNCRRGERWQIRKGEYIMNPVLEKIQKTGIIPVVVINDAKDAEP